VKPAPVAPAALPVVALTGVAASRSCPSRHPAGVRLCEVADVVLDNAGVPGDAALRVRGVDEPVCALSTIVGATILQSVVYETARRLAARGVRAPVVRSGNAPGPAEANAALVAAYRARLRHL
jgi:uncharacterized phosphosugar-binding protein